MPTPTYTPLATITLTGTDSLVQFASIPNTYKDLYFVVQALGTVDDVGVLMRYNSDSGANYSNVLMAGFNPSNTGSGTPGTTAIQAAGWQVGIGTSGEQTTILGSIMDYAATDKHKTSLIRWRTKTSGGDEVAASAGRWANTTAINTVSFAPASGSFAIGSSFSLYGIAG